MNIADLSPKNVWTIFHEITRIPRPSKREERIRQYVKKWAYDNFVDYDEDKAGNIVLRRPATKGYDDAPVITMQAHMDMVCEMNEDIIFDFNTEAIRVKTDGEWVYADGTTLGADNGIGMAGAMAALIDNSIEHGPLEVLLTVDEETGLTGAFALEEGFIKGKYLLNLDSEDEGEIFVGCAGGIDTIAHIPYFRIRAPRDYHFMRIEVKGLKGGHSGCDIHLGHGNAIKILSAFLCQWMRDYDMDVVSFEGGNLRNAIPREAKTIVAIPKKDRETFTTALNIYYSEVAEELKGVDDGFKMTWETWIEDEPIETIQSYAIVNAINACVNGVQSMSKDIEGLVETSSNLASVKMLKDEVLVCTSQRSSVESAKYTTARRVASSFNLCGSHVDFSEGYPGWKPNLDSAILKTTVETYEELFGKKPAIKAIHAGLECGLFKKKYPNLDMVSFGPTIRGVHSPNERLHIPAVANFYKHLLAIIEKVAEER